DRQGNPLKGLTAEELAEFATRSVDIAQGLGGRVIVAGLSGGGSMTTWLSQERSDVDLAVPIAPFLGVGFIPRILNRPLTNLLLLAPDIFQWWDPKNKENNPNSTPYSCVRYPTHSLLENMRLGFVAEAEAKRARPAAGAILVITNANDDSVNNEIIAEFEKMWLAHGEKFLQTFQFSKEFGLPHDLISPERPDGNIEVVYPKLHELIR
ncbi:MAG: alpha/beta hydrolase, partial [Chloroflexi bacterium]|nr:alpha/beta hydrolase [Chloroflexota bacterium]